MPRVHHCTAITGSSTSQSHKARDSPHLQTKAVKRVRVISGTISGLQLQRTPKLGTSAQSAPRSSCSPCPSERLLMLPDGNKSLEKLQNGAGGGK